MLLALAVRQSIHQSHRRQPAGPTEAFRQCGRQFLQHAHGRPFERAKRQAVDAYARRVRRSESGRCDVHFDVADVTQLTTSDKGDAPAASRAGHSSGGRAQRLRRNCPNVESLGNPRRRSKLTSSATCRRPSMPTPFAELAVRRQCGLYSHPVADSAEPNWYVETVNAPRTIFQAKKVRIQAVVAGAGIRGHHLCVISRSTARRWKTKKARFRPAAGDGRFFLPETAYGLNRGEIRLPRKTSSADDDRLPFLDRAEGALPNPVPPRRQASRGANLLSRRARIRGRMRAIRSRPNTGSGGQCGPREICAASCCRTWARFLPVSNTAVSAYVKRGGGVLISLGLLTAAPGRVPVYGRPDRRSPVRLARRRAFPGGRRGGPHAIPHGSRGRALESVRFYQTGSRGSGEDRACDRETERRVAADV